VKHLYTAAEAVRALGIPLGSITAWRAKGLLHEYGLTENRRPMYDRQDLIALRDGTKRRVARRPRKPRGEGTCFGTKEGVE
jgi:hypothetical protein